MEPRRSELDTPVSKVPLKTFRDTALGKLISNTDYTDTKEVFNLLEEKKKQIVQMQTDFVRMSLGDSYYSDADRMTKNKFYLMPSIRKSPMKSLFPNNSTAPKVKLFSEKRLSEDIEVFWHKLNAIGWKPETRQEATLTGISNELYLIGGVSRSINQDVNVCHIVSSQWEKLYPGGVEPEPRFGHSALEYKNKIIVFGGGTNFNTVHKLRECLNGIKVFHPNTKVWEYLKTSGTYISTRKYHSAAIVGRHMFIYGGLNQKNNLLADCALLNLEKNTWKSIFLEGPTENAFHTSVAVINAEQRSDLSIYKISNSVGSKVSRPGIYIFGGLGKDKKAHNKLWLVSIGKKPLTWCEVKTQGISPSPRFLHSMVYNENLNYLIIFGGRIDVSQTITYTCFNDIYFLCMKRLMWIRVRVLGDVPTARSGHCAESIGDNMFVFGGVSNTCYCSSDLFVLETDPDIVKELMMKEMKKRQFLIDVEDYRAKKVRKTKSLISKSSSRAGSRISATPSKEFYYN